MMTEIEKELPRILRTVEGEWSSLQFGQDTLCTIEHLANYHSTNHSIGLNWSFVGTQKSFLIDWLMAANTIILWIIISSSFVRHLVAVRVEDEFIMLGFYSRVVYGLLGPAADESEETVNRTSIQYKMMRGPEKTLKPRGFLYSLCPPQFNSVGDDDQCTMVSSVEVIEFISWTDKNNTNSNIITRILLFGFFCTLSAQQQKILYRQEGLLMWCRSRPRTACVSTVVATTQEYPPLNDYSTSENNN